MSVYPISRSEGDMPIYRQVRDWLSHEIAEHYRPGDTLPSELRLAERLGVNRHTLRRGVDELIAEGVVARRHGVGVIVLEATINYPIATHSRFTQSLASSGHSTSSQVLRKQLMKTSRTVAQKLSLALDDTVICIETYRAVEDKPFCLITHYLPAQRFMPVMEGYDQGSLHAFLKAHCQVESHRHESLVTAVMPSSQEAASLLMPKNEPLLRVKSVNTDIQTGEPIEYAVTRFRGSSAQLSFKP